MITGEFREKNVLITGTSKGIGKAFVHFFASQGANVYAVSRSKTNVTSENVRYMEADIKDVDKICKWLDGISSGMDILINNAGIICYEELMDVSKEQLNAVFSTNVISTLLLSQAIVKRMIEEKRNGIIVNTISFASKIPSVGSGIYAASKAALESLTRTMAAEWAPYGIRVNGYSPGVIETDMTEPAIKANGESMLNAIALRKIGKTEDVVKAVAFLASEDSSYIAGINLDVSGGKFIVQNSERAWK